jgi:plastocyanin
MDGTRPGHVAVALLACAGIASCGGGGGGNMTGTGTPAIQMAATASGNAQTATVATALANPLRVLVTVSGGPQSGETVTWATSGTGASVSPTRSASDASGIATTTWTLGQTAGTQSATATLSGATGSPITFTATGTAAAATAMSLDGGDNQVGTVGSALAAPLAVLVADRFGNPVAGVSVAWAVAGGSATVSPAVDLSDASGIARTSVTLGASAESDTIHASSSGLSGSPVTFLARGTLVPATASVAIGDIFFESAHNSTENPAVDTVAVGGTVTWTWGGALNHSVQSLGPPSFTSSSIMTGGTYSVTFNTAGSYNYDCAVHGTSMTGTIVVR